MNPTNRLRIATRIHFALLRQYGEDVAVSTLLKGEGDAREALWVCAASDSDELVTLAQQFEVAAKDAARAARVAARAAARPAAAAPRGAAPQEMAWAQDTSGFGLSRLSEFGELPAAKPASWLSPSRWLRGTGGR